MLGTQMTLCRHYLSHFCKRYIDTISLTRAGARHCSRVKLFMLFLTHQQSPSMFTQCWSDEERARIEEWVKGEVLGLVGQKGRRGLALSPVPSDILGVHSSHLAETALLCIDWDIDGQTLRYMQT